MKFIIMILAIMSLVSCGRDGGSTSSRNKPTSDRRSPDATSGMNGYLDAATVEESELLNVTSHVAMNIDGNSITFNGPVSVHDVGIKSTCSLDINSGDVWQYKLIPNGLELESHDGTVMALRSIGETDGLIGSWLWMGEMNNNKVRRRYSFFHDRVIINQDCES